MTEITTDQTTENIDLHPAEALMALIVTLLAPMFLGVTAGDFSLARLAALETVSAYQARNQADLIAIAQIIAYGLAALGSLSLSMDDNTSLSMALRLRSNANALDRSAEHNRRALAQTRPEAPALQQPSAADARYEAEVLANLEETKRCVAEAQARLHPPAPVPAPAPTPPPVLTLQDKQIQAAWASAMTDVAGEFTASLAHLPPAERKEASRRAALLSGCASELLSGNVPPRPTPGALGPFIRPNTPGPNTP
jgi:hypothetical protein